ncbi:MAG TPA: primosomal protein N' [Rhodospirillaceae bacterium]|nr:primosomal protein N' [Rhodospirillaceae bacterium]
MNTVSTSPSHNAPTVRVLLPLPVGDGYDYLVPDNLSIENGSFVTVPFGRKETIGIVWGEGSGGIEVSKLKPIKGVLDLTPLDATTRRFVDWVAGYTLTPAGSILKMVLGGQLRELKDKDKLSDALPDPDHGTPTLTADQHTAATKLVEAVKKNAFSVTLLDGVTGSGKTEVFCEAIAQCLKEGRQALVLLPEIAMTAALFSRLEKRFGIAPTLWHSNITEKQRRLNWHAIKQGKARFILGARSALFLPYDNLGLIVVDEEHEGAYKQEEGVIYHGRDMAVVRGNLGHVPVILASATPSLETMHNVQQGKYQHVVLKSRFGEAAMPAINIIDLRHEKMPSQSFISDPLLEALTQTLAAGQQAMLFLNRRGYAPLTLCRACGNRLQCPSCTSWLIEHKRTSRLHCHQCGYSTKLPDVCPACGAEDKFAACGPGIERIAEEIAERLPAARTAIMASDTLDGAKAAEALIKQMDDHEIDLLIGTQIMAKGYHFPRLTLVGVIDADLGLSGGDPRAAERTFQLLQQVAGRSGRAEDAGTVYLQTTQPDHPVMQALIKGERDAFMKAEMRERQNYHLPPFGRLATITIAGEDRAQVVKVAQMIAAAAPQNKNMRILGPAPAVFAILRGKIRYRLMIQAARNVALSPAIQAWLAPLTIPRTIKVQIDIDPYSFL